jgi:hypothetical protein
MKRVLIYSLLLMLLSACEVYVKGPEKGMLIPGGEPVVVTLTRGDPLGGELLLVTLTDLVINTQGRNLAVDFSIIRQVQVERFGLTLTSGWWQELSPYSRYPKGLTAEQRLFLKIEAAPAVAPDQEHLSSEIPPVLGPVIDGKIFELKPGDIVLIDSKYGGTKEVTVLGVSKSAISCIYNVIGTPYKTSSTFIDYSEINRITLLRRNK